MVENSFGNGGQEPQRRPLSVAEGYVLRAIATVSMLGGVLLTEEIVRNPGVVGHLTGLVGLGAIALSDELGKLPGDSPEAGQ